MSEKFGIRDEIKGVSLKSAVKFSETSRLVPQRTIQWDNRVSKRLKYFVPQQKPGDDKGSLRRDFWVYFV